MGAIRILSLGYEGRTIHDLINILTTHSVKRVLDIRLTPVSRRKNFSKKSLASHLKESGIEYVHLRLAGNPYYKQRNDIDLCLQLYSSYLDDHPEIVNTVFEELSEVDAAILCYEKEHLHCHRSVLLDIMSENGHKLDIIKVD